MRRTWIPRTGAGLCAVGIAAAFAVGVRAGGAQGPGRAISSAVSDPANLKGERVRAEVLAHPIAANTGVAALQQSLVKLRTRASLMMIVAHPDDEDGGMLAYESRGQGARVAMMTLNRGEGGQNLMSGDFNDALGLVRTQELLAADRYMGVDQMFGTEVDFGFSKTKEETYAQWTRERVLYDAVRAVRLFRPLVVTSVFVGGPSDGHGQHQVAGEMAQEVFNAAGDPKVFPEMGLEPWSPLKVYARAPFARVSERGMYDYATNKYVPARFYNYVTKSWSDGVPRANVTVHEGEPSAVLGMSYVQFARQGLALQKTQIGEGVRLAAAGAFDVGYHRYGSRVQTGDEEKSFYDGIDVTLEGIASLAPEAKSWMLPELKAVDDHAAKAAAVFSAKAPERCAPELASGLKALDALIAKVEASGLAAAEKTNVLHELRVKRVEFNDALVQSLGLRVEARMETGKPGQCADAITPNCRVHVVTKIVNGGRLPVKIVSEVHGSAGYTSVVNKTLAAGAAQDSFFEQGVNAISDKSIKLPSYKEEKKNMEQDHGGHNDLFTRPYFTRKNIEQPYYDLNDPSLRQAPQTPNESFWVKAEYDGAALQFGHVVLAPVKDGDEDRPLVFAPALSVAINPPAGITPLTEKSFTVNVEVRSDAPYEQQGRVRLALPAGWQSTPVDATFSFHNADENNKLLFLNTDKSRMFSFRVTPAALTQQSYTLKAVAETSSGTTSEGFRSVGYKGLIRTNMYTEATYRTRGVDVAVAPNLKVGYLPGTGDDVAASLENIGVHATMLSVADIAAGKLDGFDAVVLGVRAYAAHRDLAAANDRLLNYAKNGGVVIVQYDTERFDYGPYPTTMGVAEKVVDESSKVRLLIPESPVLRWPNRISERDFDGWVEERGHGFMESWDPHYDAPLETHDAEQDPQKGGLLVAKTGKGAYVYVAFALYRQLPEGVPGPYRLFANLLSLGKAPAR